MFHRHDKGVPVWMNRTLGNEEASGTRLIGNKLCDSVPSLIPGEILEYVFVQIPNGIGMDHVAINIDRCASFARDASVYEG